MASDGGKEKTSRIHVEKECKDCPACGYRRGFHVSFFRIEKSDNFTVKLICPNCGAIFDVGLKLRIEGDGDELIRKAP
jgi:ribosomal protein S27AE